MLILEDLSAEVPDTNAFHFNLTEYSDNSDTNAVLMYGYNASDNGSFHTHCQDFKRKVYFNNWSPCEFAQKREEGAHDALEKENYFTEEERYLISNFIKKIQNELSLDKDN